MEKVIHGLQLTAESGHRYSYIWKKHKNPVSIVICTGDHTFTLFFMKKFIRNIGEDQAD